MHSQVHIPQSRWFIGAIPGFYKIAISDSECHTSTADHKLIDHYSRGRQQSNMNYGSKSFHYVAFLRLIS